MKKLEKVTKFNDWVYRHLAWVNIALLVLLVLSWSLPIYKNRLLDNVSILGTLSSFLGRISTVDFGHPVPVAPFVIITFCVACLASIAAIVLSFLHRKQFCPLLNCPAIFALACVLFVAFWNFGDGEYGDKAVTLVGGYLAIVAIVLHVYQMFLLCSRSEKPSAPPVEQDPLHDEDVPRDV